MFGSDVADRFATFQRQLIGAVAQLERSLIRERQREGIELAKARGVYKGRKRRLSEEQVAQIKTAVAAGRRKLPWPGRWGARAGWSTTSLPVRGAYAASQF